MALLSEEARVLPHSAPLRLSRYLCQRCGACCRWPGEVVLEEGEVDAIAEHLGLEVTDFVERFTQLRANRQGLTLVMAQDGACSMLEGKHCRIHLVKPRQCAGFPNAWRFPGWEALCESKLVDEVEDEEARPDRVAGPLGSGG